jgi:pimeloyl-ACP methyl ester carboxylesterase
MLLARLQTSMRCVSYDLPAGIDDAAIVNHYRHEDLADDLFRLLDHLKINTCILYGFSFGSTIALRAMTQQPGRISRAILQGGFAHRSLSRAEAFVASWGRFLPGRLHQVPFFERLMAYNQREPFLAREPEVWQFFLERQGHTPIRAFASRVLMIDRLDLRPLLPGIQTPTLLVSGDRDPSVESRCREELQQGLPKVAHAEIESCGHQAHLTHPEVLCEAIRHFLSQ